MQEFSWNVRDYEVSIWTLQDSYLTTLKSADGYYDVENSKLMSWPRTRYRGQIQNGVMVLDMDGTRTFNFDIPMYIEERGQRIENPNWYTTQDGNTIVAMRKIKVIFNKLQENVDKTKSTFEFIILKVTETHEQDNCICHVECEGLAFHELGKVGYKIALNRTIYENDYSEWVRNENAKEQDKPKNNINYWLNKAGLEQLTSSNLSPTEWRYDIQMSHTDIISSKNLSPKKIYDERYVNDWDDEGKAIDIAEADEKYRLVDISESNLYNITQDIAETFGVFCRYEYYYDDTYQIIGKCIVFYNNYVKEDEGMVSFLYPSNADKISRTMDSTDITTKMFVRDVISDVNYNGLISIMNCPANYSKEDYLMNFDYLHMIGTIGDEQYNYIKEYWKEMRKANDNIIPLQESLNYLQNIKTDAEAKEKTLEESVKLDLERITESRALLNSLDSADGDEDGYITIDYRNPETLYVMKDSTSTSYDSYYVQFNSNGKQGIDPNTVELYEKYMQTAQQGEKKYFIPKNQIRHQTTIKGSDGKTAKQNEDLWGNLEATTNSDNVYLGRTTKRLSYVGTFTESISALSDLNPSTDNTVISIYLYIGEDNKEIPITKDFNTKITLKTNQLVYHDQNWNVKGDSNTNRYYIWSHVQTTQLNGQKTDLYQVEGICQSESTRKHVNYVRKLYYGSKNAPDKLPGKKTTIETTDVLNKWTTYLPTIKTGMQLWECLEYHYSSGTVHYRGVTNIDNPTSYAGNIDSLINSEVNAKENVLQNPITNYTSVYDDYNNLTKATNLWIRKKSGAYNEYKLIESGSVPVVADNSTNINNIITNLEGIKNFNTSFPEISLTESGEKYVLIRDEHHYSEGGTSFKRYNYSIVYYKDGIISTPSENKVVSATKIFYLNTKEELPTLDENEKGWTETAPKREKSTQIVYEAYRVTTSNGNKKYTNVSKIGEYKIYKNKEDPDNIPTYIYAIYRYKPDLYYKQIEEYWGKKYDNDTAALKKAQRKTSQIQKKIDTITSRLDSELESKRKQVAKFEQMMGPALRESYWQPDDEYQDYGTHKENKNMEYLNLQDKIFNNLSADISYAYYPIESDMARLGWDSNLFENETANYYESGASLEKKYYPCIDVTGALGADNKLWLDIYAEEMQKKTVEPFSVYFNPTNEIIPTGENKNDLSYCKAYTLGSQAELVKIYDASKGELKDVIMITGASELSDSELANLKATWKIGQLKIQEKNNGMIYSPRTSTMIDHNDSKWLDDLSSYRVVMPRIIIPSLKLKVGDDQITLKLPYTDNDKEKFIRLKLYEHYYINTQSYYKEDDDSYPSDIQLYKNLDNDTFTNDFKISKLRTYYTLTIRPEVYYKYFNYTKLAIDYQISNADTSIYLDAKTILKENSIPQVSYDINTIFWKSDFNNELYTKLAQIIMINDTELKFEEVFGYISQITIDLDHQDKDSIQIKNYKTKFEDLFSRIVAETEEMHKNSHNIDLASGLQGGSGASLSSPLSEEGFQKTIKDNQDLLREFLDEYFDGPNVVREQAQKMWNEAGEILGSAARSLDSVMGLTTENASILASFRENVAAALTPNVFTSDAPPSAFKPGDVWIHGENNDVSVAVSPYGFTKTRDGKLSEITGANVGFDAEKGTVDIYGQFNINMTSGENIYIAAGSDIDIIGNNTVNIGGATINLASVYKVQKVNGEIAEDDDEGDKTGGIHLLASYIEWDNSKNDWNYTKNASSKVDITGEGITMASKNGIVIKSGAGIDIKSSDDENVSAIAIDKDKGIYLGATKGLTLYSGDAANYFYGPDDPIINGLAFEGDYWVKCDAVQFPSNPTKIQKGYDHEGGYYKNIITKDNSKVAVSQEVNYYYMNRSSMNNIKYYKAYYNESTDALSWTEITQADIDIQGATACLTRDSLLLGMANVGSDSATAISMTTDEIILAAGKDLSQIKVLDGKITDFSAATLSGLQIKKDYIGLATGTNNDRSLLSLNPTLVQLGQIQLKSGYEVVDTWDASGKDINKTYLVPHSTDEYYDKYEYRDSAWQKNTKVGPEQFSGSYLWLGNEEIYLGTGGHLTVNTNNIKIQSKNLSEAKGTSDTDVEGMGFVLGKFLQGEDEEGNTQPPDIGLGFWIDENSNKHLIVDASDIRLGGDPVVAHSTILDEIPVETIKIYTLHTSSSSGPSFPNNYGTQGTKVDTDLSSVEGWSKQLPSPDNKDSTKENAKKYVWSVVQSKYKLSDNSYKYTATSPQYEGLVDNLTQDSQKEFKYSKNQPNIESTGWSIQMPTATHTIKYYYKSKECTYKGEITTNTTMNDNSSANELYLIGNDSSQITIGANTHICKKGDWIVKDASDGWIITDKITKKSKADKLWSRIHIITNKGEDIYKNLQEEPELAQMSEAARDAWNIANGTYAVPSVASSGLTIDGNQVLLGSTGQLKLLGNAEVFIGTSSSNSAMVLNKNGISIGTGADIAICAGGTIEMYSGAGKQNSTGFKITPEGINIGGQYLKINIKKENSNNERTSRFMINTDRLEVTDSGKPVMTMYKGSKWSEADSGIYFGINEGLQVKGDITAKSFKLEGNNAKSQFETLVSETPTVQSINAISSVVTYKISSSGDTVPTGTWSSTPVLPTDDKPYLWTRTVTTYSGGNQSTAYSISYKGADGENGAAGEKGKDGRYLTSMESLYWLRKDTNDPPSAPATKITANDDASGHWTLTCPTWKTGYTYYRCEQQTWSDEEVTHTAVYADYGLTAMNQYATQASKDAASAANTTKAFTDNGLLTNYEWGEDANQNPIIWKVALTSNDNLLVGANSGLWIAKSGAYSDGAALVIDKTGIALHGAAINLTTTSNTNTNVISLNDTGIHLSSTGNIEMKGGYIDMGDANNYVKIRTSGNNAGIDIKGSRIKINDNEVWARDDIFYSATPPTSAQYPADREWIWIRPNYNTYITYSCDGIATACNYTDATIGEITANYDGNSNNYITSGTINNGTSYEYEITITATFDIANSQYTQQTYTTTGFKGYIGTSESNRFYFETGTIEKVKGWNDNNKVERNIYTFTASGITSNINLRNNANVSSITIWLNTTRDDNNGRPAYVHSIIVKEKSNKILGGTLCDVYYYAAGEHP